MDYLLANLEASLELCVKMSEEDWTVYLEKDINGKLIMYNKFLTFKFHFIDLKEVLE